MSNLEKQPVVLSCRNLGKTFTQGSYSVRVLGGIGCLLTYRKLSA